MIKCEYDIISSEERHMSSVGGGCTSASGQQGLLSGVWYVDTGRYF